MKVVISFRHEQSSGGRDKGTEEAARMGDGGTGRRLEACVGNGERRTARR